jgi:hypothetical protein
MRERASQPITIDIEIPHTVHWRAIDQHGLSFIVTERRRSGTRSSCQRHVVRSINCGLSCNPLEQSCHWSPFKDTSQTDGQGAGCDVWANCHGTAAEPRKGGKGCETRDGRHSNQALDILDICGVGVNLESVQMPRSHHPYRLPRMAPIEGLTDGARFVGSRWSGHADSLADLTTSSMSPVAAGALGQDWQAPQATCQSNQVQVPQTSQKSFCLLSLTLIEALRVSNRKLDLGRAIENSACSPKPSSFRCMS